MFLRRFINRLAMSLTMMILIYAGAQAVKGQDSDGTWKDGKTGLLWTVKDNGSDMSWGQANNYCENLTLDGHSDWRLPTLDELKSLYDKSLQKQYKAKGPVELGAANVWSGTVNNSGDAWSFSFFNGGTSMSPTRGGCGTSGRALCVRPSSE